jgi:6-phosphofructokinase 1
MPLLIFLAEGKLTMEEMADKVNAMLVKRGRAVVVVSEGCDVGDLGYSKDSFGHAQFGASQTTVQQALVNHLNSKGIKAKGSARGQTFGTDQRDTAIYASTVDLDEAYRVGQKAVMLGIEGKGGFMSTILREPGMIYSVRYDKVPLDLVANSERTFPDAWLSKDKCDVTDEFVAYARPLIGEDWASVPVINGRQRFARLKQVFADKKLPNYIPEADRKKK